MGERQFVRCVLLGVTGNFLCFCGESELSNGKPPLGMVGVEFEIDGLDCLLVPERDREHSFHLRTTV